MKLIGGIGLGFDYECDVARIGYALAKKEWRKGYATEACQAMIEVAKQCGVRQLRAPVHPQNRASMRVLKKCGFQVDSRASETLFMPNLNENVKLVGLSRSLSFSAPPPTLTSED